jgi:hypothetical protein
MLSLEGALDLSVDGAAAHLEARGDTLRLDVEHPRAFLRAGGARRASGTGRRRCVLWPDTSSRQA